MIGIGIVGTNFISEWFAAGCELVPGVRAVAVCSRDVGRARAFADAHGIEGAVAGVDALLVHPGVDAVYVATPVAVHHAQVLAAIAAGKHVVCEKTMGATASEAQELVDAAASVGVVLMEAVRSLYDPAWGAVRAATGRLGTIRHAHFTKLQRSSRYDRFLAGELPNAFDPALGNSAIADIGIYVLAPALDLFGVPQSATGSSVRVRGGFEGAGSLVLTYPDAVVTCTYSKVGDGEGPSVVAGDKGILTIDSIADPTRIELRLRGSSPEVLIDRPRPTSGELMSGEIAAFRDQVLAGRPDARRLAASVAVRRLMDEQLARTAP